ncbi:DUF3828 domain-containing protein [Paraburkholderia atlantica]|uniref:DUF3828 domain-containing protein n=1 Tax=Paraburkholderia atlantica TaxID=2654982 RepID=UPI0017DB7E0F|nr:DUF3828 domain-containing protein [Paraburkholderia atlantica]MBB5505845.1 hypothetical protein [Paraburkholderia atlantica]
MDTWRSSMGQSGYPTSGSGPVQMDFIPVQTTEPQGHHTRSIATTDMHIKRFLSVLALLAFVFWQSAFSATAQPTPEGQAKAFYSWYIKLGANLTFPLLDEGIFDYVAKGTVSKLRDDYEHDRLPGDSDYFLKVQDEDENDWLAHITVRPAVMLGHVAVVPVTFGSKDKLSVIVFMRNFGGIWKITKVDDISDLP